MKDETLACRRSLVLLLPAGLAVALGRPARAQTAQPQPQPASGTDDDPFALPLLQEADPRAVELGYVADAAASGKAPHPRYAAGQQCANCVGYMGKPGETAAGCDRIHLSRRVLAKGWCTRYEARPPAKA